MRRETRDRTIKHSENVPFMGVFITSKSASADQCKEGA